MSIRKPKNAELNKVIDSMGAAARHARNAVRGQRDGVHAAAAKAAPAK